MIQVVWTSLQDSFVKLEACVFPRKYNWSHDLLFKNVHRHYSLFGLTVVYLFQRAYQIIITIRGNNVGCVTTDPKKGIDLLPVLRSDWVPTRTTGTFFEALAAAFSSGIHFSRIFWKDERLTTEKHSRKTSVSGYTRGLSVSKSSWKNNHLWISLKLKSIFS